MVSTTGLGSRSIRLRGASWFIIPGSSADAISGDDQRVLIAQLTTDGILDLVVNVQYDDANGTHVECGWVDVGVS